MSLKTLIRLAPTVLILSGLAAMRPAAAQFVVFGTAQTISGAGDVNTAGDVSTSGTLVDAYNFGSNTPIVNGTLFSAVTTVGGTGNLSIIGANNFYNGFGISTSNPFNGLGTDYKSLLTNGLYANGATAMSFTESGLTAGHRYQVQYFVNDSRGLASGRTETVTSSGGNIYPTLTYNSTGADGGVGQYVNGTFTAATSAVTMTATGNESTQINGLQYRDLGNAGAPISFGAATAITTADATLGLAGTVITAADFGAGNQTVTLTGGQVINFDGSGANATVVGGNATTTGAFTSTSTSTGNTNFNSVLNGFNYDSAAGTNNTKQITLSGLTAGQQYSLQLFGLDDRSGSIARTLSFSDFSGDSSGLITSGANDYVLGTFTAASSFETITESVPNGGNINALVLRDISAAPEPSQIASLALAALGMLGVVLKARKRKASMELN